MNILTVLSERISIVAPIHGIQPGNINDKRTWMIDYMDHATDQQKADAQVLVNGFDIAAETVKIQARERLVKSDMEMARLVEDVIENTPGLKAKLPAESQAKIDERQGWRDQLKR